MGRGQKPQGTRSRQAQAAQIEPQPPRFGSLAGPEQALLEQLLRNELPAPEELPAVSVLIAEAFRAQDEEQEWRHWTQHLLGTVKLVLSRGELARAVELCENYWPKALTYKQTANGGNTSEKELWQLADQGGIGAAALLAERERLITLLVGLDKERSLRIARTPHLEALVAAIGAGDLDAAKSALEQIASSRQLDEQAMEWATAFYRFSRSSS